MTIILFLIDTSASMNQRTFFGARPTLLDVGKDAVEKFIKIRQRDSASRGDRYMLLTFEEPPANIKAGWKESHATFMTELKNLQSLGMTTMGAALKNAFDLLNVNRMQTGIDTYGQGRCPFYLEPSIIIVITDGGRLSSTHGVQDGLNLPMHSAMPGSELTKEPFRWDQRLFALVLRLNGTPSSDRDATTVVPTDNSPVEDMCDATGGRSYAVSSQRTLMQCLESLVQKVQGGVVINFEMIGLEPPPTNNGDPDVIELDSGVGGNKIARNNNSNNGGNGSSVAQLLNNGGGGSGGASVNVQPQPWHRCRKLIYVQRSAQKGYSVGHWPIPESFWPDLGSPALPPRSAHPVVKFTCNNSEAMVIENLPFDKYELEPSPLTQYILSRKQPTVAWQVFVANSHKNSELGQPFGYLKASTNLTCVNLFVMPYNYPVLLPLLDELFKIHRCKPTREWKQQFDSYLKYMPLYYAGPLKRALQRMGAPNLIPDNLENCLSYNVLNYLKRLKNQAKAEFDKLVASVGTGKSMIPDSIRIGPASCSQRLSSSKVSDMTLTSNPAIAERFSDLRSDLNDFAGFVLAIRNREIKTESYRNPFDIPRRHLLDHIARLRANYLQTSVAQTRLQDDDQLHSLPVSQMGNYQEYLKRVPTPLREIESTPVRQHMFGNPFKIEKRMMVDEADDLVGGNSSQSSSGRGLKRSATESPPGSPRTKRRPGPLPKDFPVRRPSTPVSPMINGSRPFSPSPPSSPVVLSVPTLSPPSTPPPTSLISVPSSVVSLPGDVIVATPTDPTQSQDSRRGPPVLEPVTDWYPLDKLQSTNNVSSEPLVIHPLLPSVLNNTLSSPSVPSSLPNSGGGGGGTASVIVPNSTVNSHAVDWTTQTNPVVNSHPHENANPIVLTNHVGPELNHKTDGLVNHKSDGIVQVNSNDTNGRNTLPNFLLCLQTRNEHVQARQALFKEVRRPGRNFDRLFDKLRALQGTMEMRVYMVREVINEASRFKRKTLITQLQQFEQRLVETDRLNAVNTR